MQKYSLLARNENNFALKNAIIGFFCICRPVLRQLKHKMKMKILLFGNSYQRQSLDGIKSLIGHFLIVLIDSFIGISAITMIFIVLIFGVI